MRVSWEISNSSPLHPYLEIMVPMGQDPHHQLIVLYSQGDHLSSLGKMSQFHIMPHLDVVPASEVVTYTVYQEPKVQIHQHGGLKKQTAAETPLYALNLQTRITHAPILTKIPCSLRLCVHSPKMPAETAVTSILRMSIKSKQSIFLSLRVILALSWSRLTADFLYSSLMTQLDSMLKLSITMKTTSLQLLSWDSYSQYPLSTIPTSPDHQMQPTTTLVTCLPRHQVAMVLRDHPMELPMEPNYHHHRVEMGPRDLPMELTAQWEDETRDLKKVQKVVKGKDKDKEKGKDRVKDREDLLNRPTFHLTNVHLNHQRI